MAMATTDAPQPKRPRPSPAEDLRWSCAAWGLNAAGGGAPLPPALAGASAPSGGLVPVPLDADADGVRVVDVVLWPVPAGAGAPPGAALGVSHARLDLMYLNCPPPSRWRSAVLLCTILENGKKARVSLAR